MEKNKNNNNFNSSSSLVRQTDRRKHLLAKQVFFTDLINFAQDLVSQPRLVNQHNSATSSSFKCERTDIEQIGSTAGSRGKEEYQLQKYR